MAKKSDDTGREKFRPDTSALDREVESALGGMSLDDLYGASEQQKDQALYLSVGSSAGLFVEDCFGHSYLNMQRPLIYILQVSES